MLITIIIVVIRLIATFPQNYSIIWLVTITNQRSNGGQLKDQKHTVINHIKEFNYRWKMLDKCNEWGQSNVSLVFMPVLANISFTHYGAATMTPMPKLPTHDKKDN